MCEKFQVTLKRMQPREKEGTKGSEPPGEGLTNWAPTPMSGWSVEIEKGSPLPRQKHIDLEGELGKAYTILAEPRTTNAEL